MEKYVSGKKLTQSSQTATQKPWRQNPNNTCHLLKCRWYGRIMEICVFITRSYNRTKTGHKMLN